MNRSNKDRQACWLPAVCGFALAEGMLPVGRDGVAPRSTPVPAGQHDTMDAQAAESHTAYEAKDWAKAGKLYEELSKAPDAPPRVWLRLGVCWRSQGKYQEAIGAFGKATQNGGAPFGDYGKAVTYGAMKQTDEA